MGETTIILPDFIIIGANKAGTTSIVKYLNSHPLIHMPAIKEPMFFTSDPPGPGKVKHPRKKATLQKPYFVETLQEYSSIFMNDKPTAKRFGEALISYFANSKKTAKLITKIAPDAKIFGEASTSYLASPKKAAKLIKKIVPDVKLIAVLREPSERAISAYKMYYGNGIEKRTFDEVVNDSMHHTDILFAHSGQEYIRNGLYSQLLKEYFNLFDPFQLLILNYDELKLNANGFLNKILAFLGLSKYQFDTKIQYNKARDHLKNKNVYINDMTVKRLRFFYYRELIELQKMLNIDISRWVKLSEEANCQLLPK